MIKAIIFDVNGVLEELRYSMFYFKKHTHRSVHEYMAKQLNINPDQWFDAIDTAYAKAIEGKISPKEELSIISRNLKITPNHLKSLWIKAYKKYYKRNNKLFHFAFKLQKNGYVIAMLSDQHSVSKEALIRKEDTKRFNHVFISCDVGMRKPNPKIYKYVLKRLKLKPSEALFIDNQIWNIKPASKLGMKTILFQNNRQTIKDLNKLGICV